MLRVLLSIGPTEAMHFQTWSDKAGNALPLTDPTNGLVFPDLNKPPFGGRGLPDQPDHAGADDLPEPQVPGLLDHPADESTGGGDGRGEVPDREGLFIGQPPAFFTSLTSWRRRPTPHDAYPLATEPGIERSSRHSLLSGGKKQQLAAATPPREETGDEQAGIRDRRRSLAGAKAAEELRDRGLRPVVLIGPNGAAV